MILWFRAALRVAGNGDFDVATCFLLNSTDASSVGHEKLAELAVPLLIYLLILVQAAGWWA